ncbi:ABC transporter ATP-binding protein [Lentilactobacillus hilgardii]|jgi:ABC-2 type transport system ATP-binding protein|uniref:ABC transporter, ATP-binding protein n=2 Tax=Lentilactobacillus hilgardii TaxID=1588 RepID=C0XIT5_LENH9|nr:ATP-binding cassette domain-containing protein [Lentilactobacillus hilgardii]MCI2018023.1 ATP-binding cassette domain-containing protein [Lentilactobacillus buchneri]RRG11536.1 MAG: ATP-binding cassette domain-containing protein [Lactobacillus sp.]EEI24746.1 ABC transporter, ATP-binding protein [Lentilactobacillus hilgardii DSM 20176 = ATCC 8290]EEI72516.1 ABC transporter, ATP-binding protein [Lentilactobacillus hilgardii ATCC 27305]KRK57589.1 ABC superfamily ATP binding cassette transporte
MADTILDVEGLTKNFGSKKVLKNVSFSVEKGHIVGLVGPNGAGKSTIMKAILGLFNYPSGKITLDGQPVSQTSHQALEKVGALIEYPGIYPFLSGLQHLELFSNDGVSKQQIMDVVDKMKMGSYIKRKAKTYSLGMKQKLGIALALVNHPALIILDEPMNGLDPQANKDLRTIILDLAKQGTTFLISSHILSELEKLIDDLIVIDKGQIVYRGDMATLESGSTRSMVLQTSDDAKAKDILSQNGYKLIDSDHVSVVEDETTKMADIIKLLSTNNIEIEDVKHVHSDLETSLLDLLKNDKVKEG